MIFDNTNNAAADLTERSFEEMLMHVRSTPPGVQPRVMHIADWQLREYFGWTDEMIELRHKAGV